jgi:hypothetical protein
MRAADRQIPLESDGFSADVRSGIIRFALTATQRRTRQVEIGQQDIDGAKPITGRDEDRGLRVEWLDGAVLGGGALQQPQRRRPTATMRPPPARAAFKAATVSAEIEPHSASIRCSDVSSALTGRKAPCANVPAIKNSDARVRKRTEAPALVGHILDARNANRC